MTIKMSLSAESIRKAADKLRAYAKRIESAGNEIDRRLSEIAAEEAASHFGPEITVEALDHGVRATGEEVVFQEFGAGSAVMDPFPGGADIGIEIRQGSWSDAHQGEYARSGYEMWHHNGVEYRYIVPTNAMFHGMMKAKEMAGEVAREVLKE